MLEVVLVDDNDNEIGTMEKLEAHQKAMLHRAFSVFIFNDKNEMLLQQRSFEKYHSPGLWSNACCSHPKLGENVKESAKQRLYEEMGIKVELNKVFDFVYKAEFSNGLTEHEFDHVFIGYYNDEMKPNSKEVFSYCYKPINTIQYEIKKNPYLFSEWFKIALPKVINSLKKAH